MTTAQLILEDIVQKTNQIGESWAVSHAQRLLMPHPRDW